MVIAVAGSGGKTTLIKELARKYRLEGKKVFVTTTTHMFVEEDTLLTDDPIEIIGKLESVGYVMAGLLEDNCTRNTAQNITSIDPFHQAVKPLQKIKSLSSNTYEKVCPHADIVLVEADGSKRMPLKYPNSREPVIPDNTDEIIVVTSLLAVGKPAKEVCHRLELVKECLKIHDETIITKEHILKLLDEGYVKPLKSKYPHVTLTVYEANKKEFALWKRSFL